MGIARDEEQPSQKWFESQLATEIASFDTARPVWLESESNQVGAIHVPPALWKKMMDAPVVEVTAPMEQRVSYLLMLTVISVRSLIF